VLVVLAPVRGGEGPLIARTPGQGRLFALVSALASLADRLLWRGQGIKVAAIASSC